MTSKKKTRTLRLVVNGKAAADPSLRSAVEVLRDRGIRLDARVTWEARDAARLAAEAAREGVDVVVAVGGDGTINEVVGGLLTLPDSCPTAVAVVPLGTANDFATGAGIPKGNVLEALELALHGKEQRIDVGKVNDHHFINVASGGFGARVTAETPAHMKRFLGSAAYSLMGLVTAYRMTPYHGKLITPEEEVRGAMIFLSVGNGRYAGGGFPVAPRCS